jgi:hypothetical protein
MVEMQKKQRHQFPDYLSEAGFQQLFGALEGTICHLLPFFFTESACVCAVELPHSPLLDQHRDLLRRLYGAEGRDNFGHVLGTVKLERRKKARVDKGDGEGDDDDDDGDQGNAKEKEDED